MVTSDYHIPALKDEVLQALQIHPDGLYVDATFGGGGHARAILEILDKGKLIAFDKDPDAKNNTLQDDRFQLVGHDFIFLKNFLRYLDAAPVDGIIADLGIASHQIDEITKGFTYHSNAPLDMRMDPDTHWTAAKVLNEYSEEGLKKLFGQYGEVKNAGQLAGSIVNRRKAEQFQTADDLLEIVETVIHKKDKAVQYKSQVFQALRIEVNQEIEGLKSFLSQAAEVLKPQGRLVVIAYHSLEDRLVKNFFRTGHFSGKVEKDFYGNLIRPLEPINRKPITPSEAEISQNPRSRSAKLRVAKKSITENKGGAYGK